MNLDNFLLQFKQTTDYPTLDGMNYIMNKLNNPHKHLNFIHVAGTNGKGSICEMLNNILINSNYTVGKFISPHLITSNESICVNNQQISNNEFEQYKKILLPIIDSYKKEANREFTRFEILTSLAILYFSEKKCDIVILEVGLGGMYDCTNIISPIISVFGSISFDHTNILGNTLQEIAYQKAGIIKENSNTVIFSQDAVPIIQKTCLEKNNTLYINTSSCISNYSFDENFQYFTYKNIYNITLNLKGIKQIENASNVIQCIEILNKNNVKTQKNKYFHISKNIIENSLKNIIHPARFEKISENPLIIFDGAHNINAIDNLINCINNSYKNFSKTFIVSIITTKDYKKILEKLLIEFPNSKFIFTDGNNKEKFFDPKILYNEAQKILNNNNNNNNNISISNFKNSLNNLNSESNFIIGSFYSYNSAKEIINKKTLA